MIRILSNRLVLSKRVTLTEEEDMKKKGNYNLLKINFLINKSFGNLGTYCKYCYLKKKLIVYTGILWDFSQGPPI